MTFLFDLLHGTFLCNIFCTLISLTKCQRISHWSVNLLLEVDQSWLTSASIGYHRRDSLQKETNHKSSFLLPSFLIVPRVQMSPQPLPIIQVPCLGSLKDWRVPELLLLSVQVQYSGAGSWEPAGARWERAGHNGGTFQWYFPCPREPIFVSYSCPGGRVQTYFGFADDHTIKRISVHEAKKPPSVLCFSLKNYLEGWLFS